MALKVTRKVWFQRVIHKERSECDLETTIYTLVTVKTTQLSESIFFTDDLGTDAA